MAVSSDYELLRRLNRGGMAEVFLARRRGVEGFEKLLVLKRILPERAADEKLVRMFLDEARLAAQLTHPNIVQIFDLGQRDGEYFIAMEYLDGYDLVAIRQRLRLSGQRFPVEHAVRVVCMVLEALQYAHERRGAEGRSLGLVHRDVSPSNVILCFDGGVKLIDFGIAKSLDRLRKTQPGAVIGKIAYMAPEQCRAERVDRRADIYATGVMLYELLTGELPYAAGTYLERMQAVADGVVRDPRQVAPDLDAAVRSVLLRSLAPSPDRRFAQALEMQMDLERFLQERSLFSNTALLSSWMSDLYAEQVRAKTMRGRGLVTITEASGLAERSTDLGAEALSPASSSDETRAARAPTRTERGGALEVGLDELPVGSLGGGELEARRAVATRTDLDGAVASTASGVSLDGSSTSSSSELEPTRPSRPSGPPGPAPGHEDVDPRTDDVAPAVHDLPTQLHRPPPMGTPHAVEPVPPLTDAAPPAPKGGAGTRWTLPLGLAVGLGVLAGVAGTLLGADEGRPVEPPVHDDHQDPDDDEEERSGALAQEAGGTEVPGTGAPVEDAVVREGGVRGGAGEGAAEEPPAVEALPEAAPGRTTERRRARRASRPAKRTATLAAPAPAAQGRLTLDVDPWAEVLVEGRVLGITPLSEVALPAGRHRLLLRNAKLDRERTVSVVIRPNAVTRVRFSLP